MTCWLFEIQDPKFSSTFFFSLYHFLGLPGIWIPNFFKIAWVIRENKKLVEMGCEVGSFERGGRACQFFKEHGLLAYFFSLGICRFGFRDHRYLRGQISMH